MKKKAIVEIGSSKRGKSVPAEYREESMPDHEPQPMPAPMPPPPLPPPHVAPPPESTVAKVAQHMATVKKGRKKKYVTPDEMLDLLLAEHDRKKAKATTRAVTTQDQGKLAIRDLEEELETQPPGVAATKLKTAPVSTGLVKKKLKTKSAAGASGSQRRKKYMA